MARKSDLAAVLAEKMLEALLAARGQGRESYPLTLERLRQLADAESPLELARQALSKKPLSERIFAAPRKSPAALVVLREDLDQLVQSPRLLELLLEEACTPQKPAVPLNKLKPLLEAPVWKPFGEAVARRLRENNLPASVRLRAIGRKTEFYLARMPPPAEPEVVLAERLVRALEQQRERGAAYPLTLRHLLELAAPEAGGKVLGLALATPVFMRRARLGMKSPKTKPILENPIALAEDQERLAGSSLLLELALRAARKKTQQAASPSVLAGKVAADLKPSFIAHLDRLFGAERMPAGFGWLAMGRTKQIFLVEDAHLGTDTAPAASSAPPARSPSPPAVDFGRAFDEVFQRLDHAAGEHNFVNLANLRRELPLDRVAFDRELHRLRLAGRYTVSAAEGRHGLTPEEREAGILEDGSLLLFVSRRAP